jgi:hypothetical protein
LPSRNTELPSSPPGRPRGRCPGQRTRIVRRIDSNRSPAGPTSLRGSAWCPAQGLRQMPRSGGIIRRVLLKLDDHCKPKETHQADPHSERPGGTDPHAEASGPGVYQGSRHLGLKSSAPSGAMSQRRTEFHPDSMGPRRHSLWFFRRLVGKTAFFERSPD